MKNKPDLSFWKLWNLSFGFFGVQIAYALQSANVSRIFATLGADPHDLSYFWILPPLMGLLVQPIVGSLSDRTWNRFGRRLPYLLIGAVIAIAVMCLLPNAGSFGLAVSSAILVGLIALMLLDTSINMAMQPFKMLVGDMVNEKQKGLAYSIQSFLCNAGSIVGFVFPFLLTWMGFQNTAAEGVIPPTVIFSFYFGAAILLACVIYSMVKIKEWPPALYTQYNGTDEPLQPDSNHNPPPKKQNMFQLLAHAPKAFWTVSLVQFFCWFAFLFMWTYTNGTIAKNAFHTPTTTHIRALVYKTADGKEHQITAKYILTQDSTVILSNGSATVAGFTENNRFIPASSLEIIGEKPVVVNSMIATVDGVAQYRFNTPIDLTGRTILINSKDTLQCKAPIELRDYLWSMHGPTRVLTAGIVTHDPNTGERVIEDSKAEVIPDINSAHYMERVELNTESKEYNEAGNWVGILFAVQAVGSVLWAVVLPMFRSRRLSYSLSLVLGAIGFITASFLTDQYMLFISFLLIGCAWAAMLAWPFTILTNSLRGGNIGTYLGLFNGSICLPQIIGALAGGWILSMLGSPDQLAPQSDMMAIAGVSLLIGAACVFIIKEHTDK